MDLTSLILQILCMVPVCLGVWLIGNKKRSGFMFGIISQIFWALLFIHLKTYLLISTSVIYFILYLRGWLKWRKP